MIYSTIVVNGERRRDKD